MLSAFTNSLKIPELRKKIFLTLGILFIVRLGSQIPLPGFNNKPLQDFFANQIASGGNVLSLFNMFTGGAFLKGAVFGLGIMPYISSSIIIQLMSSFIPILLKLQKEGEIGKQKISQYTRYLTIFISILQSLLLSMAISNYPDKLFSGYEIDTYGAILLINPSLFIFLSIIILTTGTSCLMWLGEQVTQRGIGNGISLLIMIGIVSGIPKALSEAINMSLNSINNNIITAIPKIIVMLFLFFLVISVMISVTQSQRKIPIQYAKRVIGRKMYGGQSTFLPLKVNYSGVMPVIFSSVIIMFPQQIFAYVAGSTGINFFKDLAICLTQGSFFYYIVYGLMILSFSYFWVSVMFKPMEISDDLKKAGGYIPGIRPGISTGKFLDFVMTRLTLAGSIFLTIIALMPDLLFFIYDIPHSVALFFGGTGTLITVGVVLETMRQIETYLLQQNYDGFLKKNKNKSNNNMQLKRSSFSIFNELKSLNLIFWPLMAIFCVGFLAWILQKI